MCYLFLINSFSTFWCFFTIQWNEVEHWYEIGSRIYNNSKIIVMNEHCKFIEEVLNGSFIFCAVKVFNVNIFHINIFKLWTGAKVFLCFQMSLCWEWDKIGKSATASSFSNPNITIYLQDCINNLAKHRWWCFINFINKLHKEALESLTIFEGSFVIPQ